MKKIVGICLGVILLAVISVSIYFFLHKTQQKEMEVQQLIKAQKDELDNQKSQIEKLSSKQQEETKNTQDQIKSIQIKPITNNTTTIVNQSGEINYDKIPLNSIVRLVCFDDLSKIYDGTDVLQGSGVISDADGNIGTNAHVVNNNLDATCFVALQDDIKDASTAGLTAKVTFANKDSDIAMLHLVKNEEYYKRYPFPFTSSLCKDSDLKMGDKLIIAGYPTIGGFSMTLTDGIISGFDGNYIKTSAKLEHGNSGGGAYHYSGCFIGIPTSVSAGSLESLGRIFRIKLP